MAIGFVQAVSAFDIEEATSFATGTLGLTPTAGNLLLLWLYLQNNQAGRVVTPPVGWTLLKQGQDATDDWTSAVCYKVAGASESTAYTFSWTGAAYTIESYLAELSGTHATVPIHVAQAAYEEEGFDSTPTNGSITTTVDGCADFVLVVSVDGLGFGMASPAGYTTLHDGGAFGLFAKSITTAGATGARNMTGPGFSTWTYSFAVAPAAVEEAPQVRTVCPGVKVGPPCERAVSRRLPLGPGIRRHF